MAPRGEGPERLVQFRSTGLDARLTAVAKLHGETSAGAQARIELTMWFAACTDALAATSLTLSEWSCVADVVNATSVSDIVGKRIAADLSDAFAADRFGKSGAYGAKWNVDELALVKWASRLTWMADLAVRRALATWWADDLDASPEGFAAVGLVVINA